MSMFCYQCQETAKNTGCTIKGVCGKNEEVAKLQDLLIYTLKGISDIVVKGKVDISKHDESNYEVLSSLFMTITNANFDDGSIEKQILKMLSIRNKLSKSVFVDGLHDAATFTADSREALLEKAASVGVLATENEDVRSLREMIIYGLKGMAAYAEHAKNIGKED
ncbi:MAG: hydroxylamine reductase, partial [Clostridiaceae bacterium]|nr:hydroxylamine reductase [Clostridiaceae bacterium]